MMASGRDAYEYDDEDETPLVFKRSSNTTPSTSNHSNPNIRAQGVNGNTKNRASDEKTPLPSSKRPLENGSSSNQSSAKKPKLSVPAGPVKTEQGGRKAEDQRKPLRVNKVTVKEDKSDDDDDDLPIASRMKPSSLVKKNVSKTISASSRKIAKKPIRREKPLKSLPSGDGKKKWTTLEHNGVIFPPPYKSHGVKILYKGKPVDLTVEQEEVATMFAVIKDTADYNNPTFRKNFWNDWRVLLGKKHVIQKLDDCDFTPIYEWHLKEKEKKKQMSKEEKKALKEEKAKVDEKYMWAVVDGVKEKVGAFRVEPPGLFRGRGDHPKTGKVKKRIRPCEVTINIGKDAPVPECPIPGERWKEIKHDNTITCLAYWSDPITNGTKYVFLGAGSTLKGESDKNKYEKARNLAKHIDNIRRTYTKNFTSKEPETRQIAVATYLIDKLALRAGNEKDDTEAADTVGCCTLKVGNVECIPPNKIKFDFLGKDSIRYVNTVEVDPLVYKAIKELQARKSKKDDLFDVLDTNKLNNHLKELVPGLTAKVFRTYNASFTLDRMLNQETRVDSDLNQKIATYQNANKEVAIICNHQRAVSKTHGAQIEKLGAKLEELKEGLKELKRNLDRAKKGEAPLEGSDGKKVRKLDANAWETKIAQQKIKIKKIEGQMHMKEDLKTVALGTSKINYLDPRITVAWCKRNEVPIEKMFTKTQLDKFSWAMDAEPNFRF